MKVSTSKVKVEDVEDGTDEFYLKYEVMRLFVRSYNKYIKINGLKHSNKNLVKFKKSNAARKWGDKKEGRKAIGVLWIW